MTTQNQNTEEPTDEEEQDAGSPEEADLEKLQADLRHFQDLALRSQADFDNYRKRMVREKEEGLRYANASLIERLLPVLDSFELGLQAARKGGDANSIVLGFEMVEKQLQDFLADQKVEAIEAVGQEFDPNLHEAVSQQHDDKMEEGRVIHQLRKGFKLRDRLLRPATVIVSKGPENPA